MKKKIIETDFIGGQGSLTEKEELALKEFFAKKKNSISERRAKKRTEKKSKDLTTQRKVLLATPCVINGWFSPAYENPRGLSVRFLFAKLGA